MVVGAWAHPSSDTSQECALHLECVTWPFWDLFLYETRVTLVVVPACWVDGLHELVCVECVEHSESSADYWVVATAPMCAL